MKQIAANKNDVLGGREAWEMERGHKRQKKRAFGYP